MHVLLILFTLCGQPAYVTMSGPGAYIEFSRAEVLLQDEVQAYLSAVLEDEEVQLINSTVELSEATGLICS